MSRFESMNRCMCMHWLWVQKVTGAHRERTEENREADNSI